MPDPKLEESIEVLKYCTHWEDKTKQALQFALSTLIKVKDGKLVEKCICGEPNSEGVHRIDKPCYIESKPQLTEEELEKILPKKHERPLSLHPAETWNESDSYKIGRYEGYNQAINDCKQALLSKMRG